MKNFRWSNLVTVFVVVCLAWGCGKRSPEPGTVKDEAMMAGRMAQMLRIRLSRDYHCVPEISANKYALNIRFTTQEGVQWPKAAETEVEFELTFCNL